MVFAFDAENQLGMKNTVHAQRQSRDWEKEKENLQKSEEMVLEVASSFMVWENSSGKSIIGSEKRLTGTFVHE